MYLDDDFGQNWLMRGRESHAAWTEQHGPAQRAQTREQQEAQINTQQ